MPANDTVYDDMKKLFLLCLAALALPLGAGAQVFNHVALGVGAGTDGLSFELAARPPR